MIRTNIFDKVAGGSAHFLEHIDTDLEGFYRLEDRIKYLKVGFFSPSIASLEEYFVQEVLAMHAQRQIVESEELDNAEFVIQELGEKVGLLPSTDIPDLVLVAGSETI